MTEPTNEPIDDDQPEPAGTSAVVDDIEVWQATDQWASPDLTGVNAERGDQ
jgi:hypothetical protein